jgi:hypothetical protein
MFQKKLCRYRTPNALITKLCAVLEIFPSWLCVLKACHTVSNAESEVIDKWVAFSLYH